MFDFAKFNLKIDLKNLDINQLKQELVGRKTTVINALVIVGVVVILGCMLNNYRIHVSSLENQIVQMRAKMQVIATYQTGEKELKDFLLSLSKGLKRDKVISQMADYAAASHVSILSFSPGKVRDLGMYELVRVRLSIKANSYKDVLLFLRSIEKSPYVLRVESWKVINFQAGNFSCDVEISSLYFNI